MVEGRVPVNGAELFYSARGEGPACFVLSAYKQPLPPPLSGRMKLVYVDLRGGGKSTGEAPDLTFEVLADDLEAIRADLGVDRIAVLGHSMLGILALEYGRRRSDSVSHVVTVGMPPTGDMGAVAKASASLFERDASEERKAILRENLAALPPNATLAEMLAAQTPTRFYDPRFDARPLFGEPDRKPALRQHLMGTLLPAWRVEAGWQGPCPPIFRAHGRYDYTVPHVMWDGLADALPGATLRLFDRSGHQPFFEEPEAFAEALTEWMSSER